jgi:nitrate reductase NapD
MNEVINQEASAISIAGMLVHASPERLGTVQMQLAQLPGVEIHAVTPEGKLVVTVDESEEQVKGESVMRLYDIDGVLSASMIYHHFENDAAEQETSL